MAQQDWRWSMAVRGVMARTSTPLAQSSSPSSLSANRTHLTEESSGRCGGPRGRHAAGRWNGQGEALKRRWEVEERRWNGRGKAAGGSRQGSGRVKARQREGQGKAVGGSMIGSGGLGRCVEQPAGRLVQVEHLAAEGDGE